MSKTTDKVIALQQEEQQIVPNHIVESTFDPGFYETIKYKTVNIKGKPYVTVDERIKHFNKLHPKWNIECDIISLEDGVVVMKAFIKDDKGRIRRTGIASEKDGSSYINSTSYIENCETSAIGRALGFLGIGVISSIASADEVKNAINNQKKTKEKPNIKFEKGELTPLQFQRAIKSIKAGDYTKEKLLETFKLNSEQTKTLQSC